MNEIKLITKNSTDYPQKLFCMSEPPDILFALGNISLLNSFSIAVVGSRIHTLKGKILAENIVSELTINNTCIISGMAKGIDSISHQTCIENGGKTIAILGGGFNQFKNKSIFKKILENDGLILSEYFPDTPSLKHHFIRRNEIIAGLADGTIVVEGKEKSGTLITATHTLNLKKNLFTFPGDLYDNNFSGNNLLLTQGANCILSYNDLAKYYPNLTSKISVDTTIPKEYLKIYNALGTKPIQINILAQKLKTSIQLLKSDLTLMEMDGFIKKLPNENYIKNKGRK